MPAPAKVTNKRFTAGSEVPDRYPVATVSTVVAVDPTDQSSTRYNAAGQVGRVKAGEAVAILRLFKESISHVATSQDFGLATDVFAGSDFEMVTTLRDRYLRSSLSRVGTILPWTFTTGHIRTYRADARFQALDTAMRTADDARSDMQRRVLTALQAWATSNAGDRQGRPW